MSYGKFWKVKESDNGIFQGMENFGKEKFVKIAMGKF